MRVKLEQASKATMWMPTRRTNGEGRVDWEEPGAGARYPITVRTSRATGVGSTACKEGSLRQWGRLGMVGESRIPNVICGMTDHLGVDLSSFHVWPSPIRHSASDSQILKGFQGRSPSLL